MKILTDISIIADKIDIKPNHWAGNCHGISTAIVNAGLVDGHVERGHYYGDIAKGSIFHGKPLIPHTWIRLKDGRIYDPTRFAFDMFKPKVYVSNDDSDYDLCGSRIRGLMNRQIPEFDKTKREEILDFKTKECKELIMSLVGNPPFLTINELFYLANLPHNLFMEHGKEFYLVLEEQKHDALIPLDNYEYVMENHYKR